jgi:hypothetical protein
MDSNDDQPFQTPTIEQGVRGPRQEDGLILRAPRKDELLWDLEMEVAAARRLWIPEREGWWIASSYMSTVVSIVLRTFPSVLVLGPDEDRLHSRDGRAELQGIATFRDPLAASASGCSVRTGRARRRRSRSSRGVSRRAPTAGRSRSSG